MANLANTIRATVESLRDLFEYTQDIKGGLQLKVSKNHLKKTNISRDLDNASRTSIDYVEQRSPTSLYNSVKGEKNSYTKTTKLPPRKGSTVKSRPNFAF